jgi:hypothetical protein
MKDPPRPPRSGNRARGSDLLNDDEIFPLGRSTQNQSCVRTAVTGSNTTGGGKSMDGGQRDTSAVPPQLIVMSEQDDASDKGLNLSREDDAEAAAATQGDNPAAGQEEGATGGRDQPSLSSGGASTSFSTGDSKQQPDAVGDSLAGRPDDDHQNDVRHRTTDCDKGSSLLSERGRALRESTTRQRALSQPNISDAFKKKQKDAGSRKDLETHSEEAKKTPTSAP